MRERERTGGAAGAVIGLLAGIGIGLLIAKRPGSETREQLSDFLRRGRDKGLDLLRRNREPIDDFSDQERPFTGKEPFYESENYT